MAGKNIMIPKHFIELAIAGGWKERFGDSHWSNTNNQTKIWNYTAIALDPTFWQALGRALDKNQDYGWSPNWWLAKAKDFLHLVLTSSTEEHLSAFWDRLKPTK